MLVFPKCLKEFDDQDEFFEHYTTEIKQWVEDTVKECVKKYLKEELSSGV
jgi:hypothetical protein